MAPKLKIALIQLHPKPLSPDHNFNNASTFIRAAAAQGAQIAILPEYALTSWVPHSPAFPSVCRLAATRYLSQFQALAAELGIAIVPGTFIEEEPPAAAGALTAPSPTSSSPPPPPPSSPPTPTVEPEDEQNRSRESEDTSTGTVIRQNVCYFIASSGQIAGRYTKRNLWHPEREYLTTSLETIHEPFETEFGLRVGLLICWDLAFPEAMRELVRKGAQMVIVPTWWLLSDVGGEGARVNPLSEREFLNSLVVCRAFENTCAIVFVNAGGPPPPYRSNFDEGEGRKDIKVGLEYAGLSQVGMPLLGSVGRIESGEEGMSIVEIDPEHLKIAERTYKVREDLASDGWHYNNRLR